MSLRIEWIRDQSDIETLRDPWVALEQEVQQRTIYSCFDYVMPWYRCYSGTHLVDHGRPLVGLAWDGDRLVGIAPMIEAKAACAKVPLRRVAFAGYNLAAGEFLIRDDDAGAAAAFIQSLREELHFELVVLIQSPAFEEVNEVVEQHLARHPVRFGHLPFHGYAVADLRAGFDAYNKSFGWKFRSRNKHIAKKLNEAGRVRIDRVTSAEDREFAAQMRERMVAIRYKSRRTRLAGTDLVDMHVPLYDELFDTYSKKGCIDLAILSLDDQDVAFNLGLTERGIYYHTSMAFDEQWSRLSPGKYLLLEVFRYLPDSDLHTVLSHGSYEYKGRWASDFVSQKALCIFGRGWRAALAHWAAFRFARRGSTDDVLDVRSSND